MDLDVIDRGEWLSALDVERCGQRPEGIEGAIWQAELALYLDRLDEAEVVLDSVADAGEYAARVELIRAEIALWRGEYEEAIRHADAVHQYQPEDIAVVVRVLALDGRIRTARQEYAEGAVRLSTMVIMGELSGQLHQSGIIRHCRAYCYWQIGAHDKALDDFGKAVALFKKTGNVRWEGIAQSAFGMLLVDLGQFDEAREAFFRAEECAKLCDVRRDRFWARNNMAYLDIALGNYQDAVSCLLPLLDEQRAHPTRGRAEAAMVLNLAFAAARCAEWPTTICASKEAARLGSLLSLRDTRLFGLALEAFAEMSVNTAVNDRRLEDLALEAELMGDSVTQAKILSLLTLALAPVRPLEALGRLHEIRRLDAIPHGDCWAGIVADASEILAKSPIQLTPDGRLIFDRRIEWPNYDQAVETVRRWLIFGAIDAHDGNRAAAGRAIGLTRSRIHDLYHELCGESRRPAKPAASPKPTEP